MLLKLARTSLWNRRTTALLTIVSLTVSIALLLGIDHLRREAKGSFTSTLSGTDLIVGARSGSINLLLYSVFHIGNATNNISWKSYQTIDSHSSVDWTIPISLGDSHRGFRVMGTNANYFSHYRYGQKQPLQFAAGEAFASTGETALFGAVLGAQVARKLSYQLGDKIVLAHGTGDTGFARHDQHPFTVVGILQATGTPVDQTVHVSLEGIEAIHLNWQSGAHVTSDSKTQLQADKLTPKEITACLVGLKSKTGTFSLQRKINNYTGEPLLAILPGVALAELWQMLAMVENMLYIISALVLLATLIGMITTLLAAMQERQREIAILRAIGAHPVYLFALIELEVILLTTLATVTAFALLTITLATTGSWLSAEYGLFLSTNPVNPYTLKIAAIIIGLAALLGGIPAYSAYRKALLKGLVVNT